LARFSVSFANVLVSLALLSAGCNAQAPSALAPEVSHRILTEVRSRYSVPPQINISVSDPKPSDVPGFDTVVVTFTGGTHTTSHDFLLSKDHKTLAHLEKFDISQDLMSKIDVKGRPVRGAANAKVTIINFDDFQCPYCSRWHASFFPSVFASYADKIKVIYKDYPLVEIHPWAMHAAINANCLAAQNNDAYWDFADYVHSNQKEVAGKSRPESFANLDKAARDQVQKHHLDAQKLDACIQKQDETEIRAAMAEADKLGVDSTPTLFINGERLSGAIPENEMRMILDRALSESKSSVAASDAKK
jgi:protein-disulfide isomerase